MAIHTEKPHKPPGRVRQLAQLNELFKPPQREPGLAGFTYPGGEPIMEQQLPEESILGAQPSMAVIDDFCVDNVDVDKDTGTVHITMHAVDSEPVKQAQPVSAQPSTSSNFSFEGLEIMNAATTTVTTTATTTNEAVADKAPADLIARAIAGDKAAAAEIVALADKAAALKEAGQSVPQAKPAVVLAEVDPFDCSVFVPSDAVDTVLGKALGRLESVTRTTDANIRAIAGVVNKHGERLDDIEARIRNLEVNPKSITFSKKQQSTEERLTDLAWDVGTGVALGVGVTAGMFLVSALAGAAAGATGAETTTA